MRFPARLLVAPAAIEEASAEPSPRRARVLIVDDEPMVANALRRTLLTEFSLEIGAGLGPLAGKIWRVGLMGAGSTTANVDAVLAGLADAAR